MKLTYINDKGMSIDMLYSFPYFFQAISGEDGLKNELTTNSSFNQDGYSISNSRLSYRSITVTGILKGNSQEEISNRRRELLKIFNPKLKGKLIYENADTIKMIECVIEEGVKFSTRDVWRQQNFIISLMCPNPFWKDILETKEEMAVWRGDFGFELEITNDGIEMGHREPSLIINVINDGDVECGARVEFKALATVVNPSILNISTEEYIKINKTMKAGEIIVVDTTFGSKKVESKYNEVTTNAFNYIDFQSTFLQLDPGDNLFKYNADEYIDNLEVSIYYNPQYVGV